MSDNQFSYSQDHFKNLTASVLNQASKLGVSQAQVHISEEINLSAEVRNSTIEHCANSQEFSVSLTVYINNKLGVVTANNIDSINSINNLVKQAIDIANYTQADEAHGLLEAQYYYSTVNYHHNLELYNHCNDDIETLITTATELEAISMDQDPRFINSNGSSISSSEGHFYLANTNGFSNGYCFSRYLKYISIIGKSDKGMQTDYAFTKSRNSSHLKPNIELANMVSNRVARRLNCGKIESKKLACIFENQIAKEIIYSMLGALGGMSQYRKLSFLQNSLETTILPPWFDVIDNPLLVKGWGSSYFDSEGFNLHSNNIITQGQVVSYLLSSYSARKLKMQPTGHADGVSNIVVKPNFNGGLIELAATLNQGIIITETIGSGLNTVTGDYSVGACGLYVKNGQIDCFVDGITISANIKEILKNIIYVGNDYVEGSMQCGSILIAEGIVNVNQ